MNRKKSVITLGPGASSLILIFVVLSLTALGMLSLMTSRNDFRLAERSASVTQAVYALNVRAEERRAELDALLLSCAKDASSDAEYLSAVSAALPDDVLLEDDLLLFTVEDDSRMLDCALRIYPLSAPVRTAWARYNLTAETGDDSWDW